MSLQGLISGSECAIPANPLSQVLKHTEADRSVQQDRVAGPSSSRLQHLPTTAVSRIVERDANLAQQFFATSPSSPSFQGSFSIPPQLSVPRLPQHAGPSIDLSANWANASRLHASLGTPASSSSQWMNEFAKAGSSAFAPNVDLGASSQFQPVPSQSFAASPFMASGMYGLGMSGFNQMPYAPQYNAVADKGKGRSLDVDFDAAFADVTASLSTTRLEPSRIVELRDDEESMENVSHLDSVLSGAFDQSAPQASSSSDLDQLAGFEADFQQWMDQKREEGEYDFDYGAEMQAAWQNDVKANPDTGLKFNDEGIPDLGLYRFEPSNQHLASSATGQLLLQNAKELLENGGSLTEAALLLEAAIQKGEMGQGGFESWLLLGETRSMDEREEQAMQALSEGVKLAQSNGSPGAGMLTLAISYTNESYERAANATLLHWLRARFPEFAIPEETIQSTTKSAWHSQPLITEAFLALARSQHAAGVIDADVQAAMGVLFFGQNSYERARDCFQAALSQRPNDHRLWNRYGSCLSNGSKPEEALAAYREALRLRPTYTRAVYNVAVACINIGAYKEAVEHLLDALASQNATEGEKSDQLWTTLSRAFMMMDRQDLSDLTKTRPNIDVFKQEGFDFVSTAAPLHASGS